MRVSVFAGLSGIHEVQGGQEDGVERERERLGQTRAQAPVSCLSWSITQVPPQSSSVLQSLLCPQPTRSLASCGNHDSSLAKTECDTRPSWSTHLPRNGL